MLKYDTIVIGAGVIGASTAYYLKQQSPKQKILLLEQNSKAGLGNTSKSAALYRNLFSSRTSQILANCSINFYLSIADKISLKKTGYFWMFSKKDWDKIQNGLAKLNTEKDNFDILTPNEIPANLLLNHEKSGEFQDVHRILYGHRCGSLSAVKLARYYLQQFEELGGKVLFDTKIESINLTEKRRNYPPWTDVKIKSIIDSDKDILEANDYIFSTGAWTDSLLSPIGIASHIYPQKRQMFTLQLHDSAQIVNDPSKKVPILILPTGGVYVKPVLKNNLIVVGCANELGNPFSMDKYPPEAEEKYFNNVIAPVLEHYFPKLTNYKIFSKWAGYYAYYWPDKNPVIEKVSNIQWVSGTSGSGIMKADAIGRIAAARALEASSVELFDGTKFSVADLSLKHRRVDIEELII
ncbi:MAG: FAD-binding oxidoreductase [Asgard group archaeon]|nr:FAD-binding oxidoreductase [Asgard group archaeon]